MKKNIAMPVEVWRSGDEREMAKYGLQEMSNEEIAQRNQDELAHDEFLRTEKYKLDRVKEYPAVGDQLDAIWKALAAITSGQPVPVEVTDMMGKIEEVKAKYPKPKGKVNNG